MFKNGVLSMAITPEDELDKVFLQELFKNTENIQIQVMEKIQVLNVALVDSVIISSKGVNSLEQK